MSGSTFARHLDPSGAWVYEDPNVLAAAGDWQGFYGFSLAAFDEYLAGPGWKSNKARARREILMLRREQALEAHRTENLELALAWVNFLHASMQLREQDMLRMWPALPEPPLARRGKAFVGGGRKLGAVGPLRLAVRRMLKRQPDASTAAVWELLKAKPPRGMSFYDSPRLGKYVQIDGQRDTGYASFSNAVSKERGSALIGYEARKLDGGAWLISRWCLSKELPDKAAATEFLQRVTGGAL